MGRNRRISRRNVLKSAGGSLSLALAGCGRLAGGNEEVDIGSVLPMSAVAPNQAKASKRGINLAVKEVNENRDVNFEAHVQDSKCSAETGVSAFQQMINSQDISYLIGGICGNVTLGAAPVSQEKEIVQITPGSTSPKVSDAGDYVFRFWFSENELGDLHTDEMREMNKERLAVIYIENAWGKAQMNAVTSHFEDKGGEVVSEQVIQPNSSNFNPIVSKAESNDPDVYYLGVHPGSLDSILKRMSEMGIETQIFSHGGLVGSALSQGLGGDRYEGIIAGFIQNPRSEFEEKFENTYDTGPGVTAASAYDSVKVLGKLMDEEGTTDPERIKDALYDVSGYEGASGTITVDEKGDTHRPLRLLEVNDGELVPYGSS